MTSDLMDRLRAFQSQARCQPRGDQAQSGNKSSCEKFQSQARCQPRGDSEEGGFLAGDRGVSISSEMPAPWRHKSRYRHRCTIICFNLKRDASPVATLDVLLVYLLVLVVSISSEMPAPWRLLFIHVNYHKILSFNLKRDASPVATR